MGETYIAGVFGFAGILLGALIQYWCSRRVSEEGRCLELKSEAYADFINAVATRAHQYDPNGSTTGERLAAAKSRICVFGDQQVIEAIVRLERTSLHLSNRDAREAFLELVSVVRANSIAKGSVGVESMNIVLFGANSGEDDTLMDELVSDNPKFQALVAKSKASPRKPIAVGDPPGGTSDQR